MLVIWDCLIEAFIRLQKGALELITEALRMEVKIVRNPNYECSLRGDFATNIAAGRYHAPGYQRFGLRTSLRKYALKEMDSHVDSGSNPNEMAEAIFAIIQTDKPKVHYKVGAFMQKFSNCFKTHFA